MSVIRVNGQTTGNLPTGVDVVGEVSLANKSIGDLSNVTISGITSGQILVWNGSSFAPGADAGGIALTDLSVTQASASGTGTLAYNNSTGVFTYTPPDLSGSGIALTDLSVTTASAGTAALAYNNSTGVFTYTPPDLSSFITNVSADSSPTLSADLATAGFAITHSGSLKFERTGDNSNPVFRIQKDVGTGGDLSNRVGTSTLIEDGTTTKFLGVNNWQDDSSAGKKYQVGYLSDDASTTTVVQSWSENSGSDLFIPLHITANTLDDVLSLETTEDSSDAAPVLTFKRNSSSPANGDYLGQLKFKGENDADQEVIYAKVTGKISDAADGSEDGLLEFMNKKAGSNNIGMRLTSTELKLLNGTSLDVADNTITASHTSESIIANNTASGGNSAGSLLVKRTASNLTRGVNQNFTITDGGSNSHSIHQIRSRRHGSDTAKQFSIFDVKDDGTGINATLLNLKLDSSYSATNQHTIMNMVGRINITVNDGDDLPNSNTTTINMDGTTTTSHNMLTGRLDFGASSITDGAQVTFTGEAVNDAGGGASSPDRIGQLIFRYGSSEEDNTVQLRVANHDLSTQSTFSIDGEQSASSVPLKIPAFTVANLPTSGIDQGAMALVTNANTADVSTGIAHCFYDGANWKYTHLPATTVRT